MLSSFFGKDNVIPNMSLLSVCGGEMPADIEVNARPGETRDERDERLEDWARVNKCLFTIVDPQDSPKMVVEFFSGFSKTVDVADASHQEYMKPILAAAGVRYVTITASEFSEIADPGGKLDLFSFLKAQVEGPPPQAQAVPGNHFKLRGS